MSFGIERQTPSSYFDGRTDTPIYNRSKVAKINYVHKKIKESHSDTLKIEKVIHDILGNYDISTESHSFSTASICYDFFQQIDDNFTQSTKYEDVYAGAVFHDIGKIFTDLKILNKVESLTSREVNEIKKHPNNSYTLLFDSYKDNSTVLNIALYHHERWDGSGYPYGLKGEQIPKIARIFSIVDIWEALSSDRPYRKHIPPTQALLLMMSSKFEGHFDPDFFAHFIESKRYLLTKKELEF